VLLLLCCYDALVSGQPSYQLQTAASYLQRSRIPLKSDAMFVVLSQTTSSTMSPGALLSSASDFVCGNQLAVRF
jgi:hypothetical protein